MKVRTLVAMSTLLGMMSVGAAFAQNNTAGDAPGRATVSVPADHAAKPHAKKHARKHHRKHAKKAHATAKG